MKMDLVVQNKLPLVSVLLPVFNRENLVAEAIRSIQEQTLADWELIVLDDGSTDRTLEVCRSFEKKDKRVQVYSNQKNLGVGRTRTLLTGLARGRYIAVQDSDDVSHRERLARQLQVMESSPEVGLVSVVAAILDENGNVIKHYPEALYRGEPFPRDKREMVRRIFMGSGIEGPGYMFRRSLLEEIKDPYGDCRAVDDWYFFLQVAHRTQIYGIATVLVSMHRGMNHLHIGTDQKAAQAEVKQVRKGMYLRYKNDPDSPINYWLYRQSVAYSLQWRAVLIGGWKGTRNMIIAIAYNPFDKRAWRSLSHFFVRGIRKLVRIFHSTLRKSQTI